MDMRTFTEKMREAAARMPAVKLAALRKAGEMVRDEAKGLIGTEDQAWAPLADSTVEEKQRLGYVGKVSATDPLLRTGELRASIQVGEVTPEHVTVGSDDPIAAYQEFGTTKIPPRPFIGTALFREEHKIEAEIGEAIAHSLRGLTHG